MVEGNWIPAGDPQTSMCAMARSTSTIQCMPTILAIEGRGRRMTASLRPVWSIIWRAPGQNQGYPASPSLVIKYSYTQYLSVTWSHNQRTKPNTHSITYRKYVYSLWNTGKLPRPPDHWPGIPRAVSAGCWGGARKTQSYVLSLLTFPLGTHSQTAATQEWRHSSACVTQQRSRTHLVSHKAWASCGKGACSPGWGRCWCSLYLQQEGLGCGTQATLDEEDLKCCEKEMFRK